MTDPVRSVLPLTSMAARAFLNALQEVTPRHIRTLLTDKGSEFTDRLFNKQKQASGEHEFDPLCAAPSIELCLTKPRSPQSNGMVEHFNGRISDVLNTHCFESDEDLTKTLERYVWRYSQHLPELALQHQTALQAMEAWRKQQPDLFKKRVSNRPGLDNSQADLNRKHREITSLTQQKSKKLLHEKLSFNKFTITSISHL